MSGIKISQLTETTTIVNTDVIPVVNGGETKKIQFSNLTSGLASKTDIGQVSLSATWVGSSSPYSQTVTVSGATITSNSKVDMQPSASVISQLANDGVNGLFIENNNGTLTCYAVGDKPSVALSNIQVAVSEVIV